jgi:hypothetical protein
MGWNDRLPEDPYWPSHSDAEAYEEWHRYLEELRREDIIALEQGAGLSSQNVDPTSISLTPEKEHVEQTNRQEIKANHAAEKAVEVGDSDSNNGRPF